MAERYQDFIDYREQMQQGGGPSKIEKQHAKGKLTARERLELLFDPGTFEEYGLFVKHRCTEFGMDHVDIPGDGVITGFGQVNGRTVFAFAQDFTTSGGSLGEMHGKKIQRIMEEAIRAGAPLVGLNDSGGARIQEGNDSATQYFGIFQYNTMASGYIPQVSAIMGPCAGGAAYSPGLTDFIINVNGTSKMFITGPGVIRQVTGEEINEEQLGGAAVHNNISGVSHRIAANDEDCIAQIKTYLSYFPSNCLEAPPVYLCQDDPQRLAYELDEMIPDSSKRPYDCRKVIQAIADQGSLFEIQPNWAKNVVTALTRMNGSTVGFIANQTTHLAGSLDINASDKMAHFVTLCDAFNIPLVFLGDTSGYLPGVSQEHGGIIRHGAKAVYAVAQATVPKILVTIRKLYGGAAAPMCDYGMQGDAMISWPTTESAVMGAAGAVASVFRKEIQEAENPQERAAELTKIYEETYNNPYFKAGRQYTDMVILPRETRRVLIHILQALKNKKVADLPKKHGIMPV